MRREKKWSTIPFYSFCYNSFFFFVYVRNQFRYTHSVNFWVCFVCSHCLHNQNGRFSVTINDPHLLPATVMFFESMATLNSGASPDTSQRYVPVDNGDNLTNVILHLYVLHVFNGSTVWTPSTLKFMYLGTIIGAYLIHIS